MSYITRESFQAFDEHMKSAPKRIAARAILRASLGNCAVSGAQRDTMRRCLPGFDFEVVGNVIAPGPPATAPPTDIREEARMILVGAIVPRKGWDVALEALALYMRKYDSKISLTIAGQGDDRALAEAIDPLNLSGRVRRLGWVEHEEIHRLLAESHFMVLASREDSCPNVLLEAFAAGRPVVATKSGGAEDLVQPTNGILVEKDSPEALCEGIRRMVEDYDRYDPRSIQKGIGETNGVDSLRAYLDRFLPGGAAD